MLVAPACKVPLLFLSIYGDGCDDEDVGDNDEDAGDDDDGGRIASLKLHRSACLVSYYRCSPLLSIVKTLCCHCSFVDRPSHHCPTRCTGSLVKRGLLMRENLLLVCINPWDDDMGKSEDKTTPFMQTYICILPWDDDGLSRYFLCRGTKQRSAIIDKGCFLWWKGMSEDHCLHWNQITGSTRNKSIVGYFPKREVAGTKEIIEETAKTLLLAFCPISNRAQFGKFSRQATSSGF